MILLHHSIKALTSNLADLLKFDTTNVAMPLLSVTKSSEYPPCESATLTTLFPTGEPSGFVRRTYENSKRALCTRVVLQTSNVTNCAMFANTVRNRNMKLLYKKY